jgi:hypothetical protein
MTAFVTKVTKQRPVQFMDRLPRLFARRVIGLGGTNGDETFVVATHCGYNHSTGKMLIFEKIEHQSARWILGAIGMRKVPAQNGIEEVLLRPTNFAPMV